MTPRENMMPHSTQHQSFLLYKLILTLDIVSHQFDSYYKCFEGTEIVFEVMFKQKFQLTCVGLHVKVLLELLTSY